MDTIAEPPRLDPRRREAHPERIVVGDEVFLRNDVQARQLGCSERSVNRGDRHGAPYLFIGGVKYRPEKRYAAFMMRNIRELTPEPPHERSKKQARKWRTA